MMALRPHDTAVSMGARSEWKRTLSSITVGEEREDKKGGRGTERQTGPAWEA